MGCGDSHEDIMAPIGVVMDKEMEQQVLVDDGLSNPIEIRVSCENLINLDMISKSDPMAVLFEFNQKTNTWNRVGQTELINNNLNPVFVQTIRIKYKFEEKQKMKIEVYDIDDAKMRDDLTQQELIGYSEFLLADAIRAEKQMWKASLLHPSRKNNGRVTLKLEELSKKLSGDIVKITIEGHLKIKNVLFFKLSRMKENSTEFIPVYQSEQVTYTNDLAKWKIVRVGAAGLMRDNKTHPLRMEMYQYQSSGNHTLLGEHKFTFTDLADNHKWDASFGTVFFKNAELQKRPTFAEYLFGGCNISLSLAIDFTGSNITPSLPESLHYYDPAKNQYMGAIQSVGSILLDYDTDKNIPTLGFGAVLPSFPQGAYAEPSFCFALNGNIFAPEIHDIGNVLAHYKKNLGRIMFSGPTNFAPIIRYIGDIAEFYVKFNMKYNYFLLLILTDGQISDIEDSIDEIVRCSTLPVSIIIVGVGNNDFAEMDKLDADVNPLYSKKYKKPMARDIVQFVPYKKYAGYPLELAKVTLSELPRQFIDYMVAMKIPPPIQGTIASQLDINTFYTNRMNAFSSKFVNFKQDVARKIINTGIASEDEGAFVPAINFVSTTGQAYVNPMA